MLRSHKRFRELLPESVEGVIRAQKKRYCHWKGHPATLIRSKYKGIPYADCPLPLPADILATIDAINERQWINASLKMWRVNARHNSRKWYTVKEELLEVTKYVSITPHIMINHRPAELSWTIVAPKRDPARNGIFWWWEPLEVVDEGVELDYNLKY